MNDNFWSDSMQILLSDSMDSSIEAPESLTNVLVPYLTKANHTILQVSQSDKGTNNVHPHNEIFLDCGADQSIVDLVETFLRTKGVTFTKHPSVNESDHIDLGYDLNNVSVWK